MYYSDKGRIPAWCDRVLWKGTGLKQLDYRSANLKISDHRPILSLFDCTISIVDEIQKDKLGRILYDQHRSELGTMASGNNLLEDDDDVLLPSGNSPGLPPPSSDRHKWWLDNGKITTSLDSFLMITDAERRLWSALECKTFYTRRHTKRHWQNKPIHPK